MGFLEDVLYRNEVIFSKNLETALQFSLAKDYSHDFSEIILLITYKLTQRKQIFDIESVVSKLFKDYALDVGIDLEKNKSKFIENFIKNYEYNEK